MQILVQQLKDMFDCTLVPQKPESNAHSQICAKAIIHSRARYAERSHTEEQVTGTHGETFSGCSLLFSVIRDVR